MGKGVFYLKIEIPDYLIAAYGAEIREATIDHCHNEIKKNGGEMLMASCKYTVTQLADDPDFHGPGIARTNFSEVRCSVSVEAPPCLDWQTMKYGKRKEKDDRRDQENQGVSKGSS